MRSHTEMHPNEVLSGCRVRPVQAADARPRRIIVSLLGAALIGIGCIFGTFRGTSETAASSRQTTALLQKAARLDPRSKGKTSGFEVDLSLLPADKQREELGRKYTTEKNPHETGLVKTYDRMLSNGPFSPPRAKLVREAEDQQAGKLGSKLGSVHIMRSAGQVLAAKLGKAAKPSSSQGVHDTGAQETGLRKGDASADIEREELKQMEGKLKAKMHALEEKAGSEELSGADAA